MIFVFSGVSSLVFLVSAFGLFAHGQLIKKRGRVDDLRMQLTDNFDDSAVSDEEYEARLGEYATAVADYNGYVSRFPGKMIGFMVGIGTVEGLVE